MGAVILIVMEHASDWPASAGSEGAGRVALQQSEKESPGDLLRRTYDRLCAIQRAGHEVEAAVLSCNDRFDVTSLEGRVPLARALLAAVLRNGRGRLEIVARATAPNRVKQSVFALAGALTEALGGTSVLVRARFCEHPETAAPMPEPPLRLARALPRGPRLLRSNGAPAE